MAAQMMTPEQARAAAARGATLIDIRPADEYMREHIPGAVNIPVDKLAIGHVPPGEIIFHCRSGMRTRANEAALAAASGGTCRILDGGLDAWRGCGLPTVADRSQPLEIMRQVQLAAGGLILIGVLLGFIVSPAFFAVAAFVGGGLVFAGATGWCGMATLLRHMPWNSAQSA